jgi:hypothetical protein
MILTGGGLLLGFVLYAVGENLTGAIWPVFVAGAAWLYLWWLAALLFDLVFVWHLYIRSSLINRRIRDMMAAAASRYPAEATVSHILRPSGMAELR